MKKIVVNSIKKNKKQWIAATAYYGLMAQIIDPIVDIILVGDSLDMVMNQKKNTLGVDLETMAYHGKSVVEACACALVVIDMPFGSYQKSFESAFENARYLMTETGADALKLEINAAMLPTVEFLVNRGIPVMGHIGMLPQHVKQFGYFKKIGKNSDVSTHIDHCANALSEIGVFSLVVECIPSDLAKKITSNTPIPVIGIGSGNDCDGQIIVTEDILGLTNNKPHFIPAYSDLKTNIKNAVVQYANDVQAKKLYQSE